MSYILDALKKSDRERYQGEVPGLDSIHDSSPYPPEQDSPGRGKKYLFATSAVILLISISSAIWYLNKRPSAPEKGISISKKQSDIAIIEKKGVEDLSETKTIKAEQDHSRNPVSLKRTRQKIMIPYHEMPPAEQEATVIQPPEKQTGIPDIEDLPASLREGLPELHFAGHTYADDPAKRMIIINNKIVREGEKAGNNLRLDEITWTGVILNYRGQVFKVDMN